MASQLLSFAGLRFQGFGCRKFSVSVRLSTQGTGMQFARVPVTAPQVGQGTDNICFAVSSLVFIIKDCNILPVQECSILLICNKLAGQQVAFDSGSDSYQSCAKVNISCDFDSGTTLESVAPRKKEAIDGTS
jgi:hypothetical protein